MAKVKCPKTEWFIFAASILIAAIILTFGKSHSKNPKPQPEKPNITKPTKHLEGVKTLLPHRALYTVKLASAKSGANIHNISGDLAYSWNHDCEGITTDYHFDLNYQYNDLTNSAMKSHISNHEPFDAPRLDFITQRYQGETSTPHIKGHADLIKQQAHFTAPVQKTATLPKDTLFPTAFTLKLINAIKNQEKFMQSTLFDGSEEEGTLWVNSFIGKPAQTQQPPSEAINAQALSESPAHHIHLAFYQKDSSQSTPNYEMRAIFHENGVMRDIKLDYDNFSVTQSLTSLEVLDKNACALP